jgi:hypothetical protein
LSLIVDTRLSAQSLQLKRNSTELISGTAVGNWVAAEVVFVDIEVFLVAVIILLLLFQVVTGVPVLGVVLLFVHFDQDASQVTQDSVGLSLYSSTS